MSEEKKNEVLKQEQTQSERFTNAIMREYSSNTGSSLTRQEKELINGYFIGIDNMIKATESKRVAKNKNNSDHSYDNNIACNWKGIDLEDLAINLSKTAKLGLDMSFPNMLNPQAYCDYSNKKYTISFIIGYKGYEFIAKKHALEPFKNVTVELVYETDHFLPLKKDTNRKVESYEFEIKNPFNRGKIIGGFGYIEYEDEAKNKLYFLSAAEILKRKPTTAPVEFWGGEKEEYIKGKKTGKQVEITGWKDEMYFKTMSNYVYKKITLDPETVKILKSSKIENAEAELDEEINENANKDAIDVDFTPVNDEKEKIIVDEETGEILSGLEDKKENDEDEFEKALNS